MEKKKGSNGKASSYRRGTFIFHIREVPGCCLTYPNTKRMLAVRKAARHAPGCTFDIQEKS